MGLVAEVILPLAIRFRYDYRVPEDFASAIAPGMRVLVVFGKSKIYTGVVCTLREESDQALWDKLKPVDDLPDDEPVLQEWQLKLFEWIAFYYACSEGEVLKAALPSGLKLESSLRIESLGIPGWEDLDLLPREYDLLSMLQVKPSLALEEVGALWNIQNPGTHLRNMEGRGLIRMVQKLSDGYQEKMIKVLELAPAFHGEEELEAAFKQLRSAPKQEEALMLVAGEFFQGSQLPRPTIVKRIGGSQSAVKALLDKGILLETLVPEDRVKTIAFKERPQDFELSADQEAALASIRDSFDTAPSKPVLLHGVTGSGKTYLYISLIREVLAQGKQVLYLIPEIALTQQIIDKVKSEFGESVGVYHSRFNDRERVEIWRKVLAGTYQIVIGVRSSIFLPMASPGLIIVDEEHDRSFKQAEPNPRYQARDLAVYAARILGCQVVLGSATPSFESYSNALNGRYHLVELLSRATASNLPQIELVDMRIEKRNGLSEGMFSGPVLEALEAVLAKREQAILFQNRRGFAPYLVCTDCGHVPHCIHCDISMTYHKGSDLLRCHYCGYTDYQTSTCDNCSSKDLRQPGVGTERIEEALNALFPKARVARMDLDTTRTRHGFEKLIRRFEGFEIDFLVGTQMVSKGLDFENVTLVVVVDADLMLNFADFRAYENAYQLLTQVSGRAGRSAKGGKVLIQTFMKENPVLQLLQQPYSLFYTKELEIRKQLHYPPYTRLIRIELRHKNQLYLEQEAEVIRNFLLPVFKAALLGPEYPQVKRLRGEYRQHALLKLGRRVKAGRIRELLDSKIAAYYEQAPQKTLRIIIDVDPL